MICAASCTLKPTLLQYRIAREYMHTKMQMENTTSSEGVEVVASHPFSEEDLGSGDFSHVIYHFQRCEHTKRFGSTGLPLE